MSSGEVYLRKGPEWFRSEQGKQAFYGLSSVADRAVFLYGYLRQVANESYQKGDILFRIAFWFADAVCDSPLPHSDYPAILDEKANPFLSYVLNTTECPGIRTLSTFYTCILSGAVKDEDSGEWRYDTTLLNKHFDEKKAKVKINTEESIYAMHDPNEMPIAEALQTIHLKLIWAFGTEKEGSVHA